jgi:hypothetical protein
MPRNAAGLYSLPLPPVIPNTVIESDWANTTTDDLATAISDSLSRTGQGGMTAPFRIIDGTVTTPSLSFLAEPSSGLYRIASGDVGMSVQGVLRQEWTTNGTTVFGDTVLNGNLNIAGILTATGVVGPLTLTSLSVVGDLTVGGTATFNGAVNTVGKLTTAVPTTTQAGFNLPHGVAPTTPVNGDLWTTTTNMSARINGSNRIFLMSTTAQTVSAAFTWTGAHVFQAGVTFGDAAADPFTMVSNVITAPAGGLSFNGAQSANGWAFGKATAANATMDIVTTTPSTGTASILLHNAQSVVTASLSVAGTAYSGPGNAITGNGSVVLATGQGNAPMWVGNFLAGTGYLGFMTNAAERARITPEGNVGFGTATPANFGAGYISVTANAATGSNFDLYVGGVRQASIAASTSAGVFGTHTSIPMVLLAAGVERMRITPEGNVGVAMTVPPNYGAGTVAFAVNATTQSVLDLAVNGARTWSVGTLATGATMGTITNVPLTFITNSTEKARINADGTVLIGGGTSTLHKLTVNWTTGGNGITAQSVTSDPSSSFFSQRIDNAGSSMTMRINVTVAGSISHPTLTTTAYNTSSDRRLKKNIRPVGEVGHIIDNIPVVSFTWKADGIHVPVGLIAQDVCGAFPLPVHQGTDENEDPWQIDNAKFVPLLIREIQSLRERVNVLERECH